MDERNWKQIPDWPGYYATVSGEIVSTRKYILGDTRSRILEVA